MTILPYTHKPAPTIFLSKRQEKVLGKALRSVKNRMAGGIFPRSGLNEVRCVPVIGMELEVEAVKPLKPEYMGTVNTTGGPGSPGNIAHISNEVDGEANELAFYYKRDSSLVNGMEIVTHPRSIESWRENRHKISDLLRHLRDMGVRSYDTGRCGLHFHISKASFNSPLHMYKFSRFWSDNFKLSFALSRRSEASMKMFSFIQTNSAPIAAAVHYGSGGMSGRRKGTMSQVREHVQIEMPHHSAVTFTPATVEIRIFRGTMNFLTILSTMDLIDKVIQWTASQSVKELQAEKLVSTILSTKKNKKVIKLLKLKKEVKPTNIANEAGLEFKYKETFSYLSKSYSKCATVEAWCGMANKYEMKRCEKQRDKVAPKTRIMPLDNNAITSGDQTYINQVGLEGVLIASMLPDNILNGWSMDTPSRSPTVSQTGARDTNSIYTRATEMSLNSEIPPSRMRTVEQQVALNGDAMVAAMADLNERMRAANAERLARTQDLRRQARGGQN